MNAFIMTMLKAFLLLVLLFICFASFDVYSAFKNEQQKQERFINSSLFAFEDAFSKAFWYLNEQELNHLIQALKNLPYISHVHVMSLDLPQIMKKYPTTTLQEDAFVAKNLVIYKNQELPKKVLGEVTIFTKELSFKTYFIDNFLMHFTTALFKLLLLSFVILGFVYLKFVKPLRYIQKELANTAFLNSYTKELKLQEGFIFFKQFVKEVKEQFFAKDEQLKACKVNLKQSIQAYEDRFDETVYELEKANQHLLSLLTVDTLTGAQTRKQFFVTAHGMFESAKASHTPFSLCLLDLDNFKEINANHGHEMGDLVLKEFAHVVKKHLPEIASFGRVSGEEFGIIMPTQTQNMANLAENIRISLENLPIDTQKVYINVTVSSGIAQIRKEDGHLDDIVNRAEQRLHCAKIEGRNIVTYREFI